MHPGSVDAHVLDEYEGQGETPEWRAQRARERLCDGLAKAWREEYDQDFSPQWWASLLDQEDRAKQRGSRG